MQDGKRYKMTTQIICVRGRGQEKDCRIPECSHYCPHNFAEPHRHNCSWVNGWVWCIEIREVKK